MPSYNRDDRGNKTSRKYSTKWLEIVRAKVSYLPLWTRHRFRHGGYWWPKWWFVDCDLCQSEAWAEIERKTEKL